MRPPREMEQTTGRGARRPWRRTSTGPTLAESHATVHVSRAGPWWRRIRGYIGPGLMVAVGYMDPGNWATDLAGGARFGYLLISVVLLSNLMAILLQHLAVRMGVATGRDLAQACRDHYRKPVALLLWVLAEIAIAATDLAEVIGAAVALNLLFGLPLVLGVMLTVADVLLVLYLQNKGFRLLEAAVGALIAVIAGAFAIELFISRPDLPAVLANLLPRGRVVTDPGALYIAIGILGATVMPHNLYLHSSIVQTRDYERSEAGKKDAVRFGTIDSTVSLMLAFFVNGGILVVAAAVFHGTEHQDVADIHDAYRLLSPLLGVAGASTLFAVALLASGLNSTLTGTLAGQIIMEGFLNFRLSPWLRRLVTRLVAIVPAAIVAGIYGQRGVGELLILSQVILSLQLPFAVVPLVLFSASRDKMGSLRSPLALTVTAWVIAGIIIVLNVVLLYQVSQEWMGS